LLLHNTREVNMLTHMAQISFLLKVVVWLVAWAAAMAHAECSRMVVSADPAYPPLQWYDGKALQGGSIEIAKRVLDELQIPYEIRFVGPFPRVIKMAERGEIDMIATLKKTPEREVFLLYPKTSALANPIVIFQSRAHLFEFHDRSALIGRKGGITRGNQFGDGLDEFISSKLQVEEANSPASNFDKLALGRIDYFATGLYTGLALLMKRGDEKNFLPKSPYLTDTPNYLVLTRQGRCSDKLAQVDAKMAELKKNGIFDLLISNSLVRWKTSPVIADN
jgi:polar amino acid transport system substrate-binding protein